MKKLIVTIAIVLFMGMTTFAQEAFTGADGVAESGLFSLGTNFFGNGELGLFSPDYYDYEDEYEAYNNYPQNYVDNGLFGMGGGTLFSNTRSGGLVLPGSHGQTDDSNAPLGSGVVVLLGMGAAYAMKKKREK
mgnify:CR=1 FL=1|jgi:hypothetical protein